MGKNAKCNEKQSKGQKSQKEQGKTLIFLTTSGADRGVALLP